MEHTDMRIQAVAFRGFAPFADGEIDFPSAAEGDAHDNPVESPKLGMVHLLTGQNGTGKTRLLSLMAAACGNSKDLMERVGTQDTSAGYVKVMSSNETGIWGPEDGSGFKTAELFVFDSAGDGQLRWNRLPKSIQGTSLSSGLGHENCISWPASAQSMTLTYRGTVRAIDAQIAAMGALQLGNESEHLTFDKPASEGTLVCQSMANLKLAAAMEQLRAAPGRGTTITKRLESVISSVTGRTFAFDVATSPDVHLKVFWGGVSMRIAELPDGLRSIIGWLVSCIAKLDAKFSEHPSPLDVPLLLLLDEPESHLHPAWQRKLIPAAQILFPNSQMFIATHSPFVISSVNHGWIHILRANAEGLVVADKPIPCSPGDTYLDVVSDILGIQEWYDPETENLLTEFRSIRKEVIDGKSSVDHLRSKAEIIAARSESLSTMMARELRQLDRLLVSEVAEP
jgi:energy-coupling factor transporter ATP-binding protein EcfA2